MSVLATIGPVARWDLPTLTLDSKLAGHATRTGNPRRRPGEGRRAAEGSAARRRALATAARVQGLRAGVHLPHRGRAAGPLAAGDPRVRATARRRARVHLPRADTRRRPGDAAPAGRGRAAA